MNAGREADIAKRVGLAIMRATRLARAGRDLEALNTLGGTISLLRQNDKSDQNQIEHLVWIEGAARSGLGGNDGADVISFDAAGEGSSATATLERLARWAEGLWATTACIQRLRAGAAMENERFALDLAVALTASARRLAEGGQFSAAAEPCREAVALLRDLGSDAPRGADHRLADALKLLGAVETGLGNKEAGVTAAAEACRILRALSKRDRSRFLSPLASALHNMAGARLQCGDVGGAVSAAREAIVLRCEMATTAPSAFLPDLAETLSQASLVMGAAGLVEEAYQVSSEAVTVLRRFANRDQEGFQHDLAAALKIFSLHTVAVERWEEGLAAVNEEIALYRHLEVLDGDAAARPLSEALHNRATFLTMLGADQEALASASEAVDMRRSLARQTSTKARADLAASLHLCGALAVRLERFSDAVQWFEDVARMRELLRDGASVNAEADAAQVNIELARLYARFDQLAQATTATQIAAEALEVLARRRAEGADVYNYAHALLQWGNLLRKSGSTDKAIAAYESAASQREKLRQAKVSEAIAVVANQKLIVCLKRAGRLEEAEIWTGRLNVGRLS